MLFDVSFKNVLLINILTPLLVLGLNETHACKTFIAIHTSSSVNITVKINNYYT